MAKPKPPPHAGLPASDEELARRATAGDEDAERELVARHTPRLRALAERRLRGMVRRKLGASDVMQEAWLTAHVRLADFEDRGEGSFGRWLRQILDHKIRDELRRHLGTAKRDVRNEQSHAEAPQVAGQDPSASTRAMRAEDRARLAQALAMLTEGQRLVLRMAHDEGLPIAEIARRLGRNADGVYKLYGRAIEALARRLGAEGEAAS